MIDEMVKQLTDADRIECPMCKICGKHIGIVQISDELSVCTTCFDNKIEKPEIRVYLNNWDGYQLTIIPNFVFFAWYNDKIIKFDGDYMVGHLLVNRNELLNIESNYADLIQ